MKNFEILPHPSDVKIRAFGHTLEELFKNASLGMFAVCGAVVSSRVLSNKTKEIKSEGIDREALLVGFLSEIWYQAQVNKEVYEDFSEIKISEDKKSKKYKISAKVLSRPIERFNLEIKAVTFWDLKISENSLIGGGHLETTVTFDI